MKVGFGMAPLPCKTAGGLKIFLAVAINVTNTYFLTDLYFD